MGNDISIAINEVSKRFGHDKSQVVALENVSVEIRENEFFTLLGPSGCGKTTLLRLIAGFEHPSSGHIMLHGEEISHLPPYKRPVNTVFQNYALFPHMTVSENIGFGLTMQDKAEDEITDTIQRMLNLVQMEDLRDRRTDQISGGQQQRVALARALAPRPRVLLLDEPLSALDYKLRKGMQIELKRLQHETGITFIFVTHDQEEALTMSDRIAVMNRGRILQIGSPHQIYDHPAERFVADFIGDTNFLTAELLESGEDRTLIRLPSGKSFVVDQILNPQNNSDGSINIAIRPEQASLTDQLDTADFQGRITNVVYSGTDTQYHIDMPDQEEFVVRMQNRGETNASWQAEQVVGVQIESGAVQILRD